MSMKLVTLPTGLSDLLLMDYTYTLQNCTSQARARADNLAANMSHGIAASLQGLVGANGNSASGHHHHHHSMQGPSMYQIKAMEGAAHVSLCEIVRSVVAGLSTWLISG